MDEDLAKATMGGEAEHINEDIWKNVYVKYVDNVPPYVFKQHPVLNPRDKKHYDDSCFRVRDRLAIIYAAVTNDIQEHGAGIRLDSVATYQAMGDHCVNDLFPLHTREQLDVMLNRLFSWDPQTYLNLPLDEMREYFGEYIAMYFAFLEFFTKFLIPIVVVGIVFFILQLATGKVLVWGIEMFALMVIVWAVCFPIFWRKQEYYWAMRWGQLRFDLEEGTRPEFEGTYQRSAIDGSLIEYYPHSLRNQKRVLSFTIVVCFLVALVVSTVGVVALRVWAARADNPSTDYIVSVVNALVIMFFNNIYGVIAERMNEWENYETETQYENNLIIKVRLHCEPEECSKELASQLAVIFLTQLFVSNAIELGSLWFARVCKGGSASFESDDEGSRVWNEYKSERYDRTFDDYNELLVSYGYCTLFVIAFPFAPFFGFLSNIVESRIDGYKVCHLLRRPFPRRADDIGAWQFALEGMAWAVLATNLGLICFASNELRIHFGIHNREFEEVVTVICVFIIISCLWQLLARCFKDTPTYVDEHIRRMNHIEHQLQKLSQEVERFFDDLREDEVAGWEQWNIQYVLAFLQKVLVKNGVEYEQIKAIFNKYNINGKIFAKLKQDQLTKYGVKDHMIAELIIHARQLLIRHASKVKIQASMFEELANQSSTVDGGAGPVFEFNNEHLLQLANYFETEMTGQLKKKLWEKVDKDASSMIESNEMTLFLYFSFVLFIKTKFPQSGIPKKMTPTSIAKWLLHYKVSNQGLSYDEFDKYFSTWIREYHKELKSSSRPSQFQGYSGDSIGADSRKQTLLGFDGVDDESKSLSKDSSNQHLKRVPREQWPKPSIEWEHKMSDVALTLAKTDAQTKARLWDKIDSKSAGKLDADKSLVRFLYLILTYHVKVESRNAKVPKLEELQALLVEIALKIRRKLPNENSLSKQDFVDHFASYLKDAAKE
ncbi:hypothetical protein RFI_11229 [Reticulomyxa filosa]|uniref:Anoctamin transmembrane domain-containing protein n=1 Tax=Reticulomyxa filosa TaxID=46433 RepID=X6NIW8_RETFI|nr:hypothetical protein RFI_11229 [Reticulomyxa filosa]|eukprot:ETO25906.1 hypothetical protein RFI_11229 [Reticulomyxa filosa]